MNKGISILLSIIVSLLMLSTAFGESIPRIIHKHYNVKNTSGKSCTFTIVDAEGTAVWGPTTVSLTPRTDESGAGLYVEYDIDLTTLINGGGIDLLNQNYYLDATIAGNTMPSEQLTASPYALQALDSAYAVDADHATSADSATNADHATYADHATTADNGVNSVVSVGLPEGSAPTASISSNVLTLGIPKGDKGDKGDTGDPGPQGLAGTEGPAGAQGPQGIQGEQGPTGSTGPQGPQGIQGDPGLPGANGLACWDLDSNGACDTATEDINADTVCDALDCKGLQGEQGPEGLQGIQGEQGPTGSEGPQGPQGLQGEQGPTGPEGPQGPQGVQGEAGPQGIAGAQGPAGANGAQGAAGPMGPAGPQGPQGIQGPEGPQGPAGSSDTGAQILTKIAGESSPVMTLQSGGKIGVGTSVPASSLHVAEQNGSIVDRGIISSQHDNVPYAAVFQYKRSRGTTASPTALLNGDSIGAFHFYGYDGANYQTVSSIVSRVNGTVGTGSVPGELRFHTGTNSADNFSAPKMVISTSGNVGIGTPDPTQKLDVNSSSMRIRNSKTPVSSADICDQGEIAWSSAYIYVCIAPNTWKRAFLSTW